MDDSSLPVSVVKTFTLLNKNKKSYKLPLITINFFWIFFWILNIITITSGLKTIIKTVKTVIYKDTVKS